MPKLKIRNRTRQTVLATEADTADTSQKRRVGLLKHKSLPPGQGLWIVPCEGIHTFGMKFPIDVLYLDRKKKVLKVRPHMGPQQNIALPVGLFSAGVAGRDDCRRSDPAG